MSVALDEEFGVQQRARATNKTSIRPSARSFDALLAKQSRERHDERRATGALGKFRPEAQVAEKNAAETAAEETASSATAR